MNNFYDKLSTPNLNGSMSPLDWNQSRLDSHDFVKSLRGQPSPCAIPGIHVVRNDFNGPIPPGCDPLCPRPKL